MHSRQMFFGSECMIMPLPTRGVRGKQAMCGGGQPGLLSHCLTGNLPLSASSITFPPILYWPLLQDRNFAHPLWSSRRTRHPLERKRKIFHEANRGEVSVATAHRSPAARFQRRGAWKSR